MKLVKTYVHKLVARTGAGALFPERPTIHFSQHINECQVCGAIPMVQKSRYKTVFKMHIGVLDANETVCNVDMTDTPLPFIG